MSNCRVCGKALDESRGDLLVHRACKRCMTPPNVPPQTLRRSFLVVLNEDVEAHCAGCGKQMHADDDIFYRVQPLQLWCLSCGDSGKPYGL